MSLRLTSGGDVPAGTAKVARTVFLHGNAYLRLRDALGPIFADAQFAGRFAICGQPAECHRRLALVTLLEFAENLSDRRAADAVRGCIDRKYLLGLELTDPGFDASVLSAFRGRLVAANDEHPPSGSRSRVRRRTEAEGFPPSPLMLASPYDLDVRYAKKRATTWIGYKVHLTETCEDGQPPLITHVETALAPIVDRAVPAPVHDALAAKNPLPDRHPVDAGYIDADQLVAGTRDHGVILVGPVLKDNQWQARTDGAFTVEDFDLDRDRQTAACPAGQTSQSWSADHNQGRTVCASASRPPTKASALKPRRTRAARRPLTPRRREEHEMPVAARAREAGPAFAADRRRRAGIGGTLSQAVRVMALRRGRYLGLAKTHLQHVLTAAAVNLVRLAAWLGDRPVARTRRSAFVRLMTSSIYA